MQDNLFNAVDDPQSGGKKMSRPTFSTGRRKVTRWKSIIALIFIGVGLVFNLYWIWGILFLIWGINDFRNRRTYLLEDIPRSESPMLYWIVVCMWLFLGIWTLALSPAAYWLEAASGKEKGVHQNMPEKEVEKSILNPAARLFKSERFGFVVTKPNNWKAEKEIGPHSTTFHFQEPNEMGTVTFIAIDFKEPISLKDFIPHMEDELNKELPFLKKGKKEELRDPFKWTQPEGFDMKFLEYHGKYQDYDVIALIGYGVKEHNGYALLSVYGIGDHSMKKTVYDAMGSFRLLSGKSNPE